jgi:pantothenate kinase
MLKRLRRNDRDEVAVPVFDRDLEIARAGAAIIPRGVRHVLVEGNYLLLRHEPWSRLAGDFHTTVMMSASPDVLHARLVARWRSYGLSPNEIAAKVDNNDLPNGQTVMTQSTEAEFVFVSEDPMFT